MPTQRDTGSFMIVVDDTQALEDFLKTIVGLNDPIVANDIATYILDGDGKKLSVAKPSNGIKHSVEIKISDFESVLQKLRQTGTNAELSNRGIFLNDDQIMLDLGSSRLRIVKKNSA